VDKNAYIQEAKRVNLGDVSTGIQIYINTKTGKA